MIEIAVRHGPYTVRVEESDLKTAIAKMSVLQELPQACPRCGSPWRFVLRNVGKHTFYSLACLGEDPHHVDLGQYQDDERELYYDQKREWLTRAEIAALRTNK